MALNESWHVRSRAHECSASGEKFSIGQNIITALFFDPASAGYLRRDFSETSWNTGPTDQNHRKSFSHWRTIFTPPLPTGTAPPVSKQSAETLLQTLVEEDQDHTENTRYILAVMLERQKLLRETDAQPTTGGILRIYEHRKTGEIFIVKDPNIPLDQVEKFQTEVIELLSPKPQLPEPAPASDLVDPENIVHLPAPHAAPSIPPEDPITEHQISPAC